MSLWLIFARFMPNQGNEKGCCFVRGCVFSGVQWRLILYWVLYKVMRKYEIIFTLKSQISYGWDNQMKSIYAKKNPHRKAGVFQFLRVSDFKLRHKTLQVNSEF